MRARTFLTAGIAAAALLVAVPSALAQPVTQGADAPAFACYSHWQIDPGVWPTSVTDVFPTTSTYATGYWAPYAEETVPTHTKIGSYYLLCNLPADMATTGSYVFGGGTPAPAAWPYLLDGMAIPGIYPVAATSSTGTAG